MLSNHEIRERDIGYVFGSRQNMYDFKRKLKQAYPATSRQRDRTVQSLLKKFRDQKKTYFKNAGLSKREVRKEGLNPNKSTSGMNDSEQFLSTVERHPSAHRVIFSSHDPAHAAQAISFFQEKPLHMPEEKGGRNVVHLLDILKGLSANDLKHAIEAIKHGDWEAVQGLHYLRLEGPEVTVEKVRALFEAAHHANVDPQQARQWAHVELGLKGNFDGLIRWLRYACTQRPKTASPRKKFM